MYVQCTHDSKNNAETPIVFLAALPAVRKQLFEPRYLPSSPYANFLVTFAIVGWIGEEFGETASRGGDTRVSYCPPDAMEIEIRVEPLAVNWYSGIDPQLKLRGTKRVMFSNASGRTILYHG